MKQFVSQFGNPTGFLGSMVGWVMAYENRERNRWAVSLLDVQPTDHLLEIGFGPGLAVQQMARLAGKGFVAGIDYSEVMVQQGRKRNRTLVRAGRVDLKSGSVLALPYRDHTFDKALAVNSLHHWPHAKAGLEELHRVLKPGGLLVIVEQPRGDKANQEAARNRSEDIAAEISAAGFNDGKLRFMNIRRTRALAVLASK